MKLRDQVVRDFPETSMLICNAGGQRRIGATLRLCACASAVAILWARTAMRRSHCSVWLLLSLPGPVQYSARERMTQL